MSRSTVNDRCALCFEKVGNDKLIWYDSLQLCSTCHEKFVQSAYNQRCMLINSIHAYRKLIEKYENSGTIIIDTKFERK